MTSPRPCGCSCLREIDDGPIGEPGLLVPTEIAVGASA
jgi:hypothetical protein